MSTLTHHAQVLYIARCMTCGWSKEYLHAEEAAEAVTDHHDAHVLRHSCRYDEHAGWIGADQCRACDFEKPRSLRKQTA